MCISKAPFIENRQYCLQKYQTVGNINEAMETHHSSSPKKDETAQLFAKETRFANDK
jgi:hypothetical protein